MKLKEQTAYENKEIIILNDFYWRQRNTNSESFKRIFSPE